MVYRYVLPSIHELMDSINDRPRYHLDLNHMIDGVRRTRTDGTRSRMLYPQVDLSTTAMCSCVLRKMGPPGESTLTGRMFSDASVFASRIATSGSHFNKRTRKQEWDRYAARLSGPSSVAPDADRNQVSIPWPALKLPSLPSRESSRHGYDFQLMSSSPLGCFVR